MTRDEAIRCLETGIDLAVSCPGAGIDLVGTGDMGIANTTPSAAIVAAFTGLAPAQVTHRGTGIDDAALAHKIRVIETGTGNQPPRSARPGRCPRQGRRLRDRRHRRTDHRLRR